jgi:hypothetical protein
MPSPVSIDEENLRHEFLLSTTSELVHEGGIDVGFSEREKRMDVGSFREVDDARNGRQDLRKKGDGQPRVLALSRGRERELGGRIK